MGNAQVVASLDRLAAAAAARGEQVPLVEGHGPIYAGTPPPLLANLQVIRRQAAAQTARDRRFFRRGRPFLGGVHRNPYPREIREAAPRLIGLGFTHRQIAAVVSPYCSIGTIHRWRRLQLQRDYDFPQKFLNYINDRRHY